MQPKATELLNNYMRTELTTSTSQPGVFLPRPDKILEWTLFEILQQLREININLGRISARP